MQRSLQPLVRLTLYLVLILLISGIFWLAATVTHSAGRLEQTFIATIESTIYQRAERFAHQFLRDHPGTASELSARLLAQPEERRRCDEKLELMRDQYIRYVYLLWLDPQGRFRFLCDGSDDKGHTLQKFDPDRPKLWMEIYRRGEIRILDQSQYRGLWKSLLFPIRDGNRTRAMLVVDYSTEFLTTLHRLISPVQNTLRTILYITIGLALLIFVQLLLLFLIRNKSIRDPLTGVHNRGALRHMRYSLPWKHYNLLMIDLDHFKHINDTYGHDVGDMALLHTVKILRKLLHRKDHLVRHGGEEFLIFQYCGKGVDHRRHGIDLAEAILRAFRETPMHHPAYGEIHLRVSIGLYASSSGNEEFDQVLKKTDLALYRAKSSGRDCYMEVSGEEKRSDTVKFDNVKRYIEQNRIVCEYQPIFLRDGKTVVKYETLVRLRQDDGTLLYPNDFLNAIWQTNTYIRMTRQVLEKAIETFREHPIPFSVNFALQDLLDENIFALIREMASREPETISRMSIEVLEYHNFTNVERLSTVLHRFKDLGISIILDDFGAGHANFLILQHLPIDEFKIDRQLIVENLKNPKAKKLLIALTRYARETGMKTTAEFVADEQIFRALQEIPVDYLQGYYLGRPSLRIPDTAPSREPKNKK